MPVVFRFESLDLRSRATLVVPDVEAALAHIQSTFRLSDHSFDEDGDDPADIARIEALLVKQEHIRLYDLSAWQSQDTVEIYRAIG